MSGIERVRARAFTVPTDAPESDGTAEWDSTTMIVATVGAGGQAGLGYGYGADAVAGLIAGKLAGVVEGMDPLHPPAAWAAMRSAVRNAGQPGPGAMAVSIMDVALHDLRARLLGVPLVTALGAYRDRAEGYGSGGFCTYGPDRVGEQLGGWAAEGYGRVKMKVGRHPDQDPARMAAARDAIGDDVPLMVDANGAFTPSAALGAAAVYAEFGVDYLEEPVSSDDTAGMRRVRDHTAPGLAIAAGEYCWSPFDAARLLEAEAVDILQADVTRCGGITAALKIDALTAARCLPLSIHCAPAISAHVGCCLETFVHLEAFHDHLRLEEILLDGRPAFEDGCFVPDRSQPGHGLTLRESDARRYEV